MTLRQAEDQEQLSPRRQRGRAKGGVSVEPRGNTVRESRSKQWLHPKFREIFTWGVSGEKEITEFQ